MIDPAALLASLVSIPSVSREEGPVADHVKALLEGEGFVVQRHGHNLWFEVGSGSPRLLFNSHLDTVPPCHGWIGDPWTPRWEGENLHGLGANDAKGCVAAMILAAKAIQGAALQGTAVFAFVAQEETGGQGIKEVLPRLGAFDGAVVGEPTRLEVCTAQRGMVLLRCTARGKAAHAGHAQLGENAIFKASRDIQRLAAMEFPPHALLGSTRPQVTLVKGGNVHNQIPDLCEFSVDVRTTPNFRNDDFVARISQELESEVALTDLRYQPKDTGAQEPIVRAALEAAGAEAGVGSHTCSDWAFLGDIPAVKAGPGDTHRSHRPNEWLSVTELKAGAAFYEALARAFFSPRTDHV